MRAEPRLLFDNDSFLVVDKPAGMLTTSSDARPSLHDWVREHVGRAHPLSRLDHPVSGAVMFARSQRAIAAASPNGTVAFHRRYRAIVASSTPLELSGTWTWPIALHRKDRRLRRALDLIDVAKPRVNTSARSAETRFRVLASDERSGLHYLELSPVTGRTHQLRVHCQKAGASILGDRSYGGVRHLTKADGAVIPIRRLMLHAHSVEVPQVSRPPIQVVAELPAEMHLFLCERALVAL